MSRVPQTRCSPPTALSYLRLSYPKPRILQIRMDSSATLNALSVTALREFDEVLRWLDSEPTLMVAILTGTGRAFCAGADLKHWYRALMGESNEGFDKLGIDPLTRRRGKKPVIAAVNGFAFGGGFEFIVNCDIVVAADTALFGLPEVKRGLAPNGGVLPRLLHTVGMQVACELVLTGRQVTAQEMHKWGLVNKVVSLDNLLVEATRYAELIANNSPDSIICARAGLRQAWETGNVDEATSIWSERDFSRLEKGENAREGLSAFKEKRAPRWVESKL
ncbi:enoyl-CoA hydratase/isomerase [Seiridium cupressi]